MENITSVPSKEKPVKPAVKAPLDASVLNETVKFHEMQVERGKNMSPDEIIKIDTRLREGAAYREDSLMVDGAQVFLPQLSVLEYRKATLNALRSISNTPLAKRLVNSFRSKVSEEELSRELPTEEALDLASFNLELDTRLVWLALRKSNHPRVIGDFDKDRPFIEGLSNFFEIARMISQDNAMNERGVDNTKFFRDDKLRGQTETGVKGYKLPDVPRGNNSPKQVP
jgi:hypothetical protein